MKQIIFFLLLAVGLSAQNNIVSNGPTSFVWTNGAPTFTPSSSGVKLAIDRNTFKWYSFNGTSWLWDGDRIQRISGCSAPNYVPAKAQSRIVINGCSGAFVPEIYLYVGPTASDWTLLNEPGIDSLKNMSDVAITSPTNGQVLSYSSGDWVNSTLPDASATNELQTLSSGTNTVTLSNSGGTVTVDTDPTNDITSLSGGTGISVSGSGNSRTITNTGDLSNTNELQTLSISNDTLSISDGNSVVLPGGGVSWPLRGPDGSPTNPTYSFENDTLSGLFYDNRDGLFLNGKGVKILSFAAEDGGLPISIVAGDGLSETAGGGAISIVSGSGDAGGNIGLIAGQGISGGGAFEMRAGNGSVGGSFQMSAGSGPNGAGIFQATSGSSINESGGRFQMTAGSSVYETGGTFNILAGISEYANGGVLDVSAGESLNGSGGLAQFRAGNGYTYGGNIELVSGSAVDGIPGDIVFTAGNGLGEYGKIVMSRNKAVSFFPITISERDSVSLYNAGDNIYCSDCTANDGSTGVLQTYNGSTWKNHW